MGRHGAAARFLVAIALVAPAAASAAVAPAPAAAATVVTRPAGPAEHRASPSIQQIHGTTFRSPYDGKQVRGVAGVVTAVASAGRGRGFYFSDTGRGNPRASSGMYVFTGDTTPAVHPGDAVRVSGTVHDYFPDAPEPDSADLPVTEITDASWTVQATGRPVPAPLQLSARNIPADLSADAGGTSIENHQLRPDRYALDFFKAHESELVSVRDARVTGPTNEYGELWVNARPGDSPTPRGGTRYGSYAQPNTGRLLVTPLPGAPRLPQANVGDTLRGATTGPLGYSQFGGYQILAGHAGTRAGGGIRPERTRAERPGELSVATYNVENLSPRDGPATFDRLADGVVHNLATPDVLSLEEVQDNDGATDSGTTAADVTLDKLTDAIAAAGGPRYEWREIDPADGADGGQPGGNIRNAFLFDPSRVSFVDRPGGGADVPVRVTGTSRHPHLSTSPGRVAPRDPAWQDSRKPLAGELRFRGHTVFVIGNHFNSKGGDQPIEGRYQPPRRSSETQRVAQARVVHRFVAGLLRRDPAANVVTLGDLNDYEFSPALHALTAGGALTDLVTTLPPPQRYSYVYQGNSQALDHILVSCALRRPDYDIVHTNAEFADQVSDHDPQVLRAHPVS